MDNFAINRPLTICHLDDNPFELDKIKSSLTDERIGVSFEVSSFNKVDDYLNRIAKGPDPDVVLLDIDLGSTKHQGIALAEYTRSACGETVIVMCSALDDAGTISQSLKGGADDFISKSSNHAELGLRIINSYRLCMFKRGTTPSANRSTSSVAGKTMQRVAKRVMRILSSAITSVHITGETGTGKEVVADLFAANLPPGTPLIKVNCGAIAPTLLESELFGHVRGAFTGATHDKRGLIEAASGGWIFLDEVATLSSTAQVALLRAVENQEIIRVGDQKARNIKVKFLSATNENLNQMVREKKFRQDLRQRLCETVVELRPLRERPGEIEPLIQFFLKEMAGGPYTIAPPALEALCAAPWRQGNVRELRNCLRAMTELQVEKMLTPIAIPDYIWEEIDHTPADNDAGPTISAATGSQLVLQWDGKTPPSYDYLADLLLLELSKLHAGNGKISIRALAKLIDMSRSTLSGRLKGLPQKGLIELKHLANIVGISEKNNQHETN